MMGPSSHHTDLNEWTRSKHKLHDSALISTIWSTPESSSQTLTGWWCHRYTICAFHAFFGKLQDVVGAQRAPYVDRLLMAAWWGGDCWDSRGQAACQRAGRAAQPVNKALPPCHVWVPVPINDSVRNSQKRSSLLCSEALMTILHSICYATSVQ